MKIRQYTAGTMQEARLKIKMDLGPDAVILHTRSFKKGGIFGLFGKEVVEVLAAADAPDLGPSLRVREPELTSRIQPANTHPFSVPAPAPTTTASSEVAEIKEAMGEVKRMLGAMMEQGPVRAEATTPLSGLQDQLLAAELRPELARELVSKLAASGTQTLTPEALRSLEPHVAAWFSCGGPIEPHADRRSGPKIVALVGPTGVGKTTTIAKLAANFRLLQQLKVALITIDTYRVAAVEQLRTYGDIIGIPVEVVVTPSALRDAIARFQDKDVILIDTAGRSPSNRLHLHELKGYLEVSHPKEIHLVLSATTNRANLERIVEAFSPVGVDRVLFTKIDESAVFGGMISVAKSLGKPLSYITTGQSVPDDIRVAESSAIARMLVDELHV
ncbi:MAG TPA: flagellar biosynthesis protein FlhF [Stenomitos sp.]